MEKAENKNTMPILAKLSQLQSELKAPKSQFNKFGGFKYRSLEDINEAIKPYLAKLGLVLIVSDEIVTIGDRFYIKAIASIIDENGSKHSATAYAREPLNKKGMDEAQVTGSASSYARKYALNGLLCLDDNQDADSQDNTQSQAPSKAKKEPLSQEQVAELSELIELSKTELPKLLAYFKVNALQFVDYAKCKTMLRAKIQKTQGEMNA